MSVNERLFHWFWKKQRNFRNRKEREFEFHFGLRLQENQYRLSVMAFALAGKWIDIAAAEESGGFIGERLYLPRVFCLTHDADLNRLALFYRLAFSITSRSLGFELSQSLASTSERRLFDFAVIPIVEGQMKRDYPGLMQEIKAFKEAVLIRRLPVNRITEAFTLYEALNQHFLGRPLIYEEQKLSPAMKVYDLIACWASQQDKTKLNSQAALNQLRACLHQLSFQISEEGILPLWGRLALSGEKQTASESQSPMKNTTSESLPEGTEKEKSPTESAKLLKFDEDNLDQMPVQMIIEQLKTLEKFLGGKKTVDASDELEMHSEALEEVDIREVFRSKKQAQSIFRSDLALSPAEIEINETDELLGKSYFYNEWDYRKKSYRHNWCQVVESRPKVLVDATVAKKELVTILKKYRRQMNELKKKLDSLLLSRSWKNRQPEGDEVDLDQMVDRFAALKSGHSPSERLYLSRRKSERDMAVLLLLDMSLSTGSWIGGNEVMTIAKESLVMIHQAFSDVNSRVALAGFYSHTRTRCAYVPLKDFQENWNLKTQSRLLSLKPAGYTRIGPALRHSIELLRKKTCTRKAILLITDGKPTDYDAYEGRYGIEDVRQAVREANGSGIGIYGLPIDQRARTYFPQMFGHRHFSILSDPRELPQKLLKWYMQLFYTD